MRKGPTGAEASRSTSAPASAVKRELGFRATGVADLIEPPRGGPPGPGPVLAEFHSALVTDSKKKRTCPFNQSRFALLKLLLTRAPNGGLTPIPHLCDTDDAPYNLGRLLGQLADLQDAASSPFRGRTRSEKSGSLNSSES